MEKLYQNKEWLFQKYIIEMNSMGKIGKMGKCSYQTIRNWLRKFGILIRTASESNKGKKRTNETKQRISVAKKGCIPWNKGKTGVYSEETKKKWSKIRKGKSTWNKGIPCSDEVKHKISDANKGKKKPCTEEHKKKQSEASKKRKEMDGYINSPKTRMKISKTLKEKYNNGYINPMYGKSREDMKGEKNFNWNPNRAEVYAPYGENFYNEHLRSERWNLQNGRDLLTGQKLEWGKKAHYHHIDWNKSNDDPDNHVWLNSSTHMRVHSKRKRKYYENLLKNNLQTLKQGKVPETWKAKNKEMFRQENMIQLQLINI